MFKPGVSSVAGLPVAFSAKLMRLVDEVSNSAASSPESQIDHSHIQPTASRMKRLGTLLALLLLTCAVQAVSITTIQLHNRPAEEIIPIVKPMLGAGEVVTGSGFNLFLRASPQSLEQVREIIDALDTAAKMLQVSVFQGSERDLKTRSVGGNLQIENGDASIGIGSGKNKNAGGISFNSGKVSGDINASSTQQRQSSKPVHQLRVSEGTEGFIETGEQIPYLSGDSGTEYKDVTTGFYVLPRIHGDMVTLQISPFKNSRATTSTGSIETQSARTTITGRIGEWLPLGGITEQSKRSQNSIGSSSSTKSRSQQSIWIRADLVQ
jgi:type II secretory pathway component GspD/PulD (secretin)